MERLAEFLKGAVLVLTVTGILPTMGATALMAIPDLGFAVAAIAIAVGMVCAWHYLSAAERPGGVSCGDATMQE